MRSNDGVNFVATGVTNPLLLANTQPVYDSQNLADPEVVKVGNTWMIFYEMEQTNYGHIGVAFSSDGVNYSPYGGNYSPPKDMLPFPTDGNPVIHFSNDTWYEHDTDPTDNFPRLGEPAVIFKDGEFQMWYGDFNPQYLTPEMAVYANASDPKGPWTKTGPVLADVSHPDVVFDPERNLYVMIYLSPPFGAIAQYCDFFNAPGTMDQQPDQSSSTAQGGWEGSSLYRSSMVQVGTQWYLYYSANSSGYDNTQIGLAREIPGIRKAEISTDGGVNWAPLTVDSNGNWTYSWTPTSDGIYSVKVRVTDDWMTGKATESTVLVGKPNPILVIVNSSSVILVNIQGRF